MNASELIVVGGGLAGSEAAWQLAQRGFAVCLYEMRPVKTTGAHQTSNLAELVCSNSLGSLLPDRASGLLKDEMQALGSFILDVAQQTQVPAGGALAVDRVQFSARVTEALSSHPLIRVIREELPHLPDTRPAVIASGPLTSPSLAESILQVTGEDHLYFYDALAPIVEFDSIDHSICFRASRYDRGEQTEGDYLNCPLNREEYYAFREALLQAPRIELREFEKALESESSSKKDRFFEGCLPIEILAARGEEALAFGPMRPVGLTDPRTGKRPHAVVQLRQDNLAGSLYNLVGFQTNIKWGEQEKILRMIPGLQHAEFIRMGQMHRNTFLNSPSLLTPALECRSTPGLFFAGQLTGVEGYMGNAATGLLAGINAARLLQNRPPLILPPETMLGALCHYITHADPKNFQPMKANFGILPPLSEPIRNKRQRYLAYVSRSKQVLPSYLQDLS